MTAHLPRTRTGDGPATAAAAGDRGQVSIYLVLMIVPLLAVIGLVIDGGTVLAARGRAGDLAAEAARAGADQLTAASLRTGDPAGLRVDPTAAAAAGQALITAAGATGTITVTGPGEVRASVRIRHRTAIWSVIGIDEISAGATATAVVLHGTTTGQR